MNDIVPEVQPVSSRTQIASAVKRRRGQFLEQESGRHRDDHEPGGEPPRTRRDAESPASAEDDKGRYVDLRI